MHLESLVSLSSLELLLDLNGNDSTEGQEDKNENNNNTCWEHLIEGFSGVERKKKRNNFTPLRNN